MSSSSGTLLPPAALDWRGVVPVSTAFGDVYFSAADGLAESRHVFLAGTGLPDAWRGRRRFCIAETGFGTGLNFLACWDLWRRSQESHVPFGARLDYVAVEKYPLAIADFERALSAWPSLADLAAALIRIWPLPVPGFHRLHVSDDVTLTLFMGDVVEGLKALEARVDAWFLDGFAPARNPDMWRSDMFAEMARLSKSGACVATYTVAGHVRRALAAAGFEVNKAPGFGSKRSMLRGRYAGPPRPPRAAPWYHLPRPQEEARRAAVIGAGLAGTAVAAALSRRGWQVALFDRQSRLASGASGNPAGIFMPRLDVNDTAQGRFYTAAYLYGLHRLARLNTDLSSALSGVLDLAETDAVRERQQKCLARPALPEALMRSVTAQEASRIAAVPLSREGLFFPRAGVLDPGRLCRVLAGAVDLILGRTVFRLHRAEEEWRLLDEAGAVIATTPVVVLANGIDAARYEQIRGLPLHAFRGQISYVPARAMTRPLRTVLLCGGYVTPALEGRHIVGAPYREVTLPQAAAAHALEAAGHEYNLRIVKRLFPNFPAEGLSALGGRAAVRCTTPDHDPVVGPVPDFGYYARAFERLRHGADERAGPFPPARYHPGLYAHLALGSRGLLTALLSAEILASQIAGDPWPVARDVAAVLHPARFAVRALRRGRSLLA